MSVLAAFCCHVMSMEINSDLSARCIVAWKSCLAVQVNHVECFPTEICLLLQTNKLFEEINSLELTLTGWTKSNAKTINQELSRFFRGASQSNTQPVIYRSQ